MERVDEGQGGTSLKMDESVGDGDRGGSGSGTASC